MKTNSIVKGNHTRKTAAFVRVSDVVDAINCYHGYRLVLHIVSSLFLR